jgi:hypothetical protein
VQSTSSSFAVRTNDATLTFYTEKRPAKRRNQTGFNLVAEAKNEIWGTMGGVQRPDRNELASSKRVAARNRPTRGSVWLRL